MVIRLKNEVLWNNVNCTGSVLTTATEPDCGQIARSQSAGSRHHFVNYDPVPQFDRGYYLSITIILKS